MAQKTLKTTSEVIAALGGPTKLGRRYGWAAQRVCNWRTCNEFPHGVRPIIAAAAFAQGLNVSAALTDVPRTVLGRVKATLERIVGHLPKS